MKSGDNSLPILTLPTLKSPGAITEITFFSPPLICIRRCAEKLGVQVCDERVALHRRGQLLVDPDGRSLSAQPHLPGVVLRLERHHAARRPRLG